MEGPNKQPDIRMGKAWTPDQHLPLLKAAEMQKRIHLAAFKKTEGRPATPQQISKSGQALQHIDKCEEDLKLQLKTDLKTEYYLPEDEISEHEIHRFCLQLYVIHTLREIHAGAAKRGDDASYMLFLSAVSAARQVLSIDFMDTCFTEMVTYFTKAQGRLDACAEVFGTKSYDIEGAVEHFKFPLARLRDDLYYELAAEKEEEARRDFESLPAWEE